MKNGQEGVRLYGAKDCPFRHLLPSARRRCACRSAEGNVLPQFAPALEIGKSTHFN